MLFRSFIVNPSTNHSRQLSCKFIIDHRMGSKICAGPFGGRRYRWMGNEKRVTLMDERTARYHMEEAENRPALSEVAA